MPCESTAQEVSFEWSHPGRGFKYGLDRYVFTDTVWFLRVSTLKIGDHFSPFWYCVTCTEIISAKSNRKGEFAP